ncbi:copper resistance CopC family protein [Actinomadura flavalba]|uniref:copper resistance CopC family protein n=1 Tax=Actinomadura flavalba TaxID=1120938 RepID=UPI00035E6493|nr:copper resistance CopC family protein [Actinomadura flavalba]
MIIRTSRALFALLALGLVAVLGTALAAPASAHSRLVSSTPKADATATQVTEVELTFSDAPSAAKVVVTDDEGTQFQAGEAARAGTVVTQRLKGALPGGAYTVAYRIVGADGHPVESDDLTFVVAQGGEEEPAGLAPAESTAEPEQNTTAGAGLPAKNSTPSDDDGGVSPWIMVLGGLGVGVLIGLAFVLLRGRRKRATASQEPARTATGETDKGASGE